MATDCYKLFKTTYNQGIADGLTSGASQVAAQTAMAACLAAQQLKPSTVATPFLDVESGRVLDHGPLIPPKEKVK